MNRTEGTDIELVDLESQIAAAVGGEVEMQELPTFFGRAFGAVMQAVNRAGLSLVGPPFGFYPRMPADTVKVEAGFPTSGTIEPRGDVHPLELPAGPAMVTLHIGPYEAMEATYGRLMAWAAQNGHQPADHMWEYYLSDPETEPDPATWRTRVVWPVVSR